MHLLWVSFRILDMHLHRSSKLTTIFRTWCVVFVLVMRFFWSIICWFWLILFFFIIIPNSKLGGVKPWACASRRTYHKRKHQRLVSHDWTNGPVHNTYNLPKPNNHPSIKKWWSPLIYSIYFIGKKKFTIFVFPYGSYRYYTLTGFEGWHLK